MSAIDPVAALLRRLDQPVQPRAEFADSLLARLLEELADGAAPAGRPSRFSFRLPRILPGALPRLRLVLIVIALLLVLAGIATATYLGVKEWVSAGPRGVQVTSDYRLATVFRDSPGRWRSWVDFSLGPGGKDLYGLRQPPSNQGPQRRAELVRVPGVSAVGKPVKAEHVLSLDELTDPLFWDPGVDFSRVVVGPYTGFHLEGGSSAADTLAAAENGDLFLVVGVWPKRDEFEWFAPPSTAAVLVRHDDGSLEKVLTVRELVREALPGANPENVAVEIAASDPGRVWMKARAGEPSAPNADLGRYSVFEVVDPDGDGRWDDRAVRRISLPDSIPTADFDRRGFQRTKITQIEAEPNSDAFVLAAAARGVATGRFRIFRIEDRDGDGDASDRDEVAVLVDRSAVEVDSPPRLSVRLGTEGDLVVAGLTRETRLTLVSPSGEETDIGRSFEILGNVLAGAGGDVFAIRRTWGTAARPGSTIVYRLTPIEDRRSAAAPTTAATAPPRTRAPRDVPRIAFTLESSDFQRGRVVAVRADGRGGVKQLLPGRFNHGFCQSADGKRMAYYSDAEAPRENFLYLANVDGSDRRKITEQQLGFWCGFSERWLLLTHQTGVAVTLIRRDLRTGEEKELARDVDRLALSPDGNTILYVGGLDFSDGVPPTGKETLELLDLNTLEQRRLAGPLARGSYGDMKWSLDGRRIAYTTGPPAYPAEGQVLTDKIPPSRRVLTVRDTRSGSLVLKLTTPGGPPSVSWSPDSRKLLVCVPARGFRLGCSNGLPQTKQSARLLLVDLSRHSRHVVVRSALLWAGWSPTGSYGYATDSAVYVVAADGSVRELEAAPRRTRAGSWLGFSPDGRYIGLGDFSSQLGVVDVRTGAVSILLREREGREYFSYRKWWR